MPVTEIRKPEKELGEFSSLPAGHSSGYIEGGNVYIIYNICENYILTDNRRFALQGRECSQWTEFLFSMHEAPLWLGLIFSPT